jgi:hypothetical protein
MEEILSPFRLSLLVKLNEHNKYHFYRIFPPLRKRTITT